MSNSFRPISDALTITDTGEAAVALHGLLQRGEPVTVDLRDANDLDVSGLQLLIAAQRSAERTNSQFSILARRGGALEQALMRVGLLGVDGAPRNAREQVWADIIEEGARAA